MVYTLDETRANNDSNIYIYNMYGTIIIYPLYNIFTSADSGVLQLSEMD